LSQGVCDTPVQRYC